MTHRRTPTAPESSMDCSSWLACKSVMSMPHSRHACSFEMQIAIKARCKQTQMSKQKPNRTRQDDESYAVCIAELLYLVDSYLRKTAFLSHLYIKTIILPRQARDKHRENSKKDAVFRTSRKPDPVTFPLLWGSKSSNVSRRGSDCATSASYSSLTTSFCQPDCASSCTSMYLLRRILV
jgi:hypothetical protein